MLRSLGLVFGWFGEVDNIRKEVNTESKDYEDLIIRTLPQKGYNNLMKLSAAKFLTKNQSSYVNVQL